MDSLLANYASSDDDEGEKEPSSSCSSLPKPSLLSSLPPPKIPASTSSSSFSLLSSLPAPKSKQIDDNQSIEPKHTKPIFSSLPPPKSSSSSSSSLCSSVPSPKSQQIEEKQSLESKQQRPIFSVLPPPKSRPSSDANPKRVVQFTLPLNPSLLRPGDFDDEDEEEERKPTKDSFNPGSAPKGLSSMLPAPKNSLCLAPTAASRRSAFDPTVSGPSNAEGLETRQESSNLGGHGSLKAESFDGGEQQQQERGSFEGYGSYSSEEGVSGYENYGSYDGDWAGNGSMDASYASSYQSYQSGGGYENYGSYGCNWSDTNVAAVAAPVVPEMERIVGKRGRNEIPAEIVEVNQAELMKNRPREDQVKMTGIAFGPAYQPVSSSKGKPSKLHKRKHQIGSLFFDMKQKEMELAERRAKGFLTKSETQAKYGW